MHMYRKSLCISYRDLWIRENSGVISLIFDVSKNIFVSVVIFVVDLMGEPFFSLEISCIFLYFSVVLCWQP